jgi:hypothetical protein
MDGGLIVPGVKLSIRPDKPQSLQRSQQDSLVAIPENRVL